MLVCKELCTNQSQVPSCRSVRLACDALLQHIFGHLHILLAVLACKVGYLVSHRMLSPPGD